MTHLFDHPRSYVCPRTVETPTLDGRLDERVWGHAPWTEAFIDIEGAIRPVPRYRTRAKMMWDDQNLYIGALLEEPHVWGTLTEHDCVIYQDNDFEVFLDPSGSGHHYVELEVNALNTTWDLMLPRPYRSGGVAYSGWEFHGLRTAVHIDGTLNDASDQDRSWSVEVAIPWGSVKEVADRECPPRDGDQWRINFSRVEWDVEIDGASWRKVEGRPENNWVWSPQGAIDMHRPERWGILQFSDRTVDLPPARPLPEWSNTLALVDLWEAQAAWKADHGAWATSLEQLGVAVPGLELVGTGSQFEATLGSVRVDHQLRFSRV